MEIYAGSADKQIGMSSIVRRLAALTLAAGSIAAFAQTEPGASRFVMPNTKAVISLDWSRVQKSHVGTMMQDKWLNGTPIPGVEFLESVDRLLIASPGKPADAPDGEAPVLVVVSGHFDLAKVRAVLAQHHIKPQKYNTFQVYRPQGKDSKDVAFALVDTQTILIGDSRSIFASLDRSAFPVAPAAGSLLARAAEMDANFDVWAIVNTPDALGGDRLKALLTGSDNDVDARGFEFGMALRNGLAADITLIFGSEATAKKMATQLAQMIKLSAKDKLGEPAMQDLEKKMKFTAQGSTVKLSLRLTAQELEKNAKIFATTRAQASTDRMAQMRAVMKGDTPKIEPPAPPAKPEKRVIRIEGLDNGPREIPYQDKP